MNHELNQHLDYLDECYKEAAMSIVVAQLERLVELQKDKIMQLSLDLHKSKCDYNRLEEGYKTAITELQRLKE